MTIANARSFRLLPGALLLMAPAFSHAQPGYHDAVVAHGTVFVGAFPGVTQVYRRDGSFSTHVTDTGVPDDGRWEITFSDAATGVTGGIAVQISVPAAGSTLAAASCSVVGFDQTVPDVSVEFQCFDATGTPVESGAQILVLDKGAVGPNENLAFTQPVTLPPVGASEDLSALAYTYNPAASGPNTTVLSHTAVGEFTIDFKDLATVMSADGSVQVTPWVTGTGANRICSTDWEEVGNDVRVYVTCAAPDGSPADAYFYVLVNSGEVQDHGYAYVYYDESDESPVTNTKTYNPYGDVIVDRVEVGHYVVMFQNTSGTPRINKSISVTPVEPIDLATICMTQSFSWAGPHLGARVFCFDHLGNPVDTKFSALLTSPLARGSVALADDAGWRLLSIPSAYESVSFLTYQNLVQGIAESYPSADPNLFLSYNGPTVADYEPATSISDDLEIGKGFFWYLFDDTDFTGGIPPEFVDIENFELLVPSPSMGGVPTATFSDIPATDGGDVPAYMIGNPFWDPFQLSGITVDDGTLQTNFFAWDPATSSYVTLSETDFVSIWQGVWAEVTGGTMGPTFSFDHAFVDVTQNPPIIGLHSSESFALDLQLHGTLAGGKAVADISNRIRFEPDAMLAWDRHDGSKFYPPVSTEGYALLSLEGVRQGDDYRQSVRSLPSGLDEAVTIPLAFLSGETGEFTLSAEAAGLPDGWAVTLRDLEMDAEANLLEASYAFSGTAGEDWQDRFTITITPAGVSGTENGPTELHVSNPTPNPATTTTALVLRVPETQSVAARVYDALGRLVLTAFDRTLEAGEEARLEVDTSTLAAGAYVVRVTGSDPGSGSGTGFSETRRFMVVR